MERAGSVVGFLYYEGGLIGVWLIGGWMDGVGVIFQLFMLLTS